MIVSSKTIADGVKIKIECKPRSACNLPIARRELSLAVVKLQFSNI